MNINIEDIIRVLGEVVPEFIGGEHETIVKALQGKIHRTVGEFGLDSLDRIEIIMAVEDELGIGIEDSIDGKITESTLVEELPKIFHEYAY